MSVILPGRSHLSEHESVDGGKEGGGLSRGLGGPIFCVTIFVVLVLLFCLFCIWIGFKFLVCGCGDDRARNWFGGLEF